MREISSSLIIFHVLIQLNNNLEYVATHLIKKEDNNLHGLTKFIFNNLYCGKISQSIYKIYEFNLKR